MARLLGCPSLLCTPDYVSLLGPGSESGQKLWHCGYVAPLEKVKETHVGQSLSLLGLAFKGMTQTPVSYSPPHYPGFFWLKF